MNDAQMKRINEKYPAVLKRLQIIIYATDAHNRCWEGKENYYKPSLWQSITVIHFSIVGKYRAVKTISIREKQILLEILSAVTGRLRSSVEVQKWNVNQI